MEAQGVAQTVTKSVSIQEDLLKAILSANEAFLRGRKTDPVTVERDDMVRKIIFLTVSERLARTEKWRQGVFHSNLQTKMLKNNAVFVASNDSVMQYCPEASVHLIMPLIF